MKITIRGNSKYYQSSYVSEEQRIKLKEYVLEGDFSSHDGKLQFLDNGYRLQFFNRNKLIEFSNKIRGYELDKLPIQLDSIGYPKEGVYKLKGSSLQELGMIKSIFIILPKLESELISNSGMQVFSNLYNDITLDYSGYFGKQRDIYFLPEKYNHNHFKKSIEILMEINLLCELKIEMENYPPIIVFFIPLVKPGVNKKFLIRNGDTDAYYTWKAILDYRNTKFHEFLNNY